MNSDLERLEASAGAQFACVDDLELPARFGAWQQEWTAVRQGCGLLDARFRRLLRVTGSDRIAFLQGMLTNDVAGVQNGQGIYAALLTIQGKIVSDLRVYAVAEELWLDVPAGRAQAVREALERYIIADDVEFAGDEWAVLVALEGPHAVRTVTGVFGETLETLPPFAHRAATFGRAPIRIAAVTHSGESGYLVFGSPAVAAELWQGCRQAGAAPIGMEALDVLRLEAGTPWYGRDMDEGMLISEIGLEAAISYRKGCYLGQEVVERVAARGQVHRKLIGLSGTGEHAPPPQSKLTRDTKEVGWITSAAWSPARQQIVALGYANRDCWEPGSQMQVTWAQSAMTVRVETLPFYVRPS